jgi:hypothetical protein
VHDGGTGIYTEAGAPGVEIYGCIVYNNGWQAPLADRGHGHAIYIKNESGTKLARDNVLFNQFGFGVHEYSDLGDGGLNGITLEGNVSFDNGALAIPGTSGASNLLVGGEEPVNNSTVVDNTTYYAPGISLPNVRIGYATVPSGSVTLSGNYAVGGDPVLEVGYWSSADVTGDTLAGAGDMVTLTDPTLPGQTWSGNRYYRDPSASAWRYLGTPYSLDGWRTATALSATDEAVASMPDGPRVVVPPASTSPAARRSSSTTRASRPRSP